jgi:hypothetical protein
MRNERIGLGWAMLLSCCMATAGCSSSSDAIGGTGGSSSSAGGGSGGPGTGGSVSSGGTAGTGGSPSTANAVTTLSGTTALSVLQTNEVDQLCTETYAYFGSAIPQPTACKWKGLRTAVSSSAPNDSELQKFCSDSETGCLQGASGSTDVPSCASVPSTCTALVADYATCISDEVTAFTQAVSELADCATATLADMPAVWDVMGAPQPPSCVSLDVTCAGLGAPNPAY